MKICDCGISHFLHSNKYKCFLMFSNHGELLVGQFSLFMIFYTLTEPYNLECPKEQKLFLASFREHPNFQG